MKISKFIKDLEEIMKEYGDIDVCIIDGGVYRSPKDLTIYTDNEGKKFLEIDPNF